MWLYKEFSLKIFIFYTFKLTILKKKIDIALSMEQFFGLLKFEKKT